ncbi:Hypothetical predicted protein [Octopus vulgaris]|uniref:Uncharacterized protein n=1 Tax=Octopus vulgaris TaxID=6645 RepID=A0AA36BMP4_OCTVU|nr:Hypothetical predicted protein [Octopus vulgaris]
MVKFSSSISGGGGGISSICLQIAPQTIDLIQPWYTLFLSITIDPRSKTVPVASSSIKNINEQAKENLATLGIKLTMEIVKTQ